MLEPGYFVELVLEPRLGIRQQFFRWDARRVS